ncbi:sugar phosphate nucleotidyltransferase, partial [Escherichia coli]|uniref:sugar phosphate nucleotidyltransferase n=1 Tax=Escherichia coli TaxID=562 RepID=UPI003F291C4E
MAEPAKRNTAGALVWATAQLLARGVDPASASMAVLAADQKIHTTEAFAETVQDALQIAESSSSLVTIGIKTARPDTGYG